MNSDDVEPVPPATFNGLVTSQWSSEKQPHPRITDPNGPSQPLDTRRWPPPSVAARKSMSSLNRTAKKSLSTSSLWRRQSDVGGRQQSQKIEELEQRLANALQENETLELKCNTLTDTLDKHTHMTHTNIQQKDRDIAALQQRYFDLKKSIAVSTRSDSTVTDDHIRDQFGKLSFDIQNWILKNFRRAKIDPCQLTDDVKQWFADVSCNYDTLLLSSRIKMLIAATTRAIMLVFENSLYFKLPSISPYKELQSAFDALSSQTPAFQRWRASTVGLLLQTDDALLQQSTAEAADDLVYRIDRSLTQATQSLESITGRQVSLRAILDDAIRLSRLLKSQRALFHVTLDPSSNSNSIVFDPQTMEDVDGDGDDEGCDAKTVRLVMSPLVLKLGDERGENLNVTNVVVKARVTCEEVTSINSDHTPACSNTALSPP